MNVKTWVPLVLAVVLGLVAMKVAKDVLDKRGTPDEAPTRLTQAVAVRRSITPGSVLTADDLTTTTMSGEVDPASVFRDVAEVEGRVVTAPMFKGQPVVESLLAPRGTGSGLQALVPRGMRAITLEVNEFSGLAGFLVPGCRVDVVSTLTGEGGETVSRTIVQDVEVTALGRRQQAADPDEGQQTKSVTLLVKPAEAEAIELAAATGRPRLVLRSSGDKSMTSTEGISAAELRGRKKKDPFANQLIELIKPVSTPATMPVQKAPQIVDRFPQQRTVTVIRGGVESRVTVELPTGKNGKLMTDAK